MQQKTFPRTGYRAIRPWLYLADGILVCEMHPSADGAGPFWVHRMRTRRALAKWIRDHKRCGFQGVS